MNKVDNVEKIWLKSYDAGIPAEIHVDENDSLAGYFERSCSKHADKIALHNFGAELTYAQFEEKSRYFAAFLLEELGLKVGDRFAIMLPNLMQYAIAVMGALRVGVVVVNVNPLYTAPEVQHQLKDSGAKAILVLANFASVVETALPGTAIQKVMITEIGDMLPIFKRTLVNFVIKYVKRMVPAYHFSGMYRFQTALTQGAKLKFKAATITTKNIAFLQYTGGTTGVAKGAVLTHGNMLSNIAQLHAWIPPRLLDGTTDIMVTALPLYHIFSLTVNLWLLLQDGTKNILITNPRDIPSFIKELGKSKFTVTTGVNTLFNGLLNNPEFAKVDFSNIRYVIAGGMALQASVAERWQKITGRCITQGYGLTEASPVTSCMPVGAPSFTGGIGLPLPSTEMAVMDDEGNMLPPGTRGELCARGPQVMQGYWQQPKATAEVITQDGWLRTGDIAKMDEKGYFYIVDRKKNMIIVSGFKIYPSEIEEVLVQMPQIKEAAVIGIPDERSGERVKAFVVKQDPNLTSEEVLEYCHKNLTAYKIPRMVEFRDDLPKTNVGKILHRVLMDEEARLRDATTR
jgi:long-chain acyl-CoA synthetase